MLIGNREFDVKNKTYIMGILNITPDSFSDGGSFYDIELALKHAEDMIKKGAHILDIGGESTRPGHTQITDAEEITRIVPVIKAIKENFDIPISVDTYKSKVAEAAILAGADLINDIWGLKYDGTMAEVIARYNKPCCLMHNRRDTDYQNFMEDVKADLRESVKMARKAGITADKIILDPGVGFAKTYEQNLEIIAKLGELKDLDCPILLGTSRKSVIGLTLDLPVEERLEGTLATTVMAVEHGCAFVRVHDVQANARAVLMTEKILQSKKNIGI
ncbi:MAG: dihydropteroate synthase [Roseburia sp.]|nr:dihydropteroate synthase [Roseburia sp.]